MKVAPLHPPLPLSLSEAELRVARGLSGRLKAVGVQLQCTREQVVAVAVPAVLVERERAVLQKMVHTHLEVGQPPLPLV